MIFIGLFLKIEDGRPLLVVDFFVWIKMQIFFVETESLFEDFGVSFACLAPLWHQDSAWVELLKVSTSNFSGYKSGTSLAWTICAALHSTPSRQADCAGASGRGLCGQTSASSRPRTQTEHEWVFSMAFSFSSSGNFSIGETTFDFFLSGHRESALRSRPDPTDVECLLHETNPIGLASSTLFKTLECSFLTRQTRLGIE